MTWTPYPRADRHYALHEGLVLTAQPNGAWSVHDTLHRYPCRFSVLAPVLGPFDLQGAKLKAQEAAKQMLDA